jgi:phosphomannomutase / phosphoglucomutase
VNHSIFKKYDIRGIVDKDFTPQDAELIAKGIVTYLLSKDPGLSSIAVGMDGRVHSPEIHEIVVRTLADIGIDVVDLEVCPTPILSLVLFTTNTTTGLMITASHNPAEYNGIKIFHNTKAIWGDQIQQIKKLVENKTFVSPSGIVGSVSEHDAIATYAA